MLSHRARLGRFAELWIMQQYWAWDEIHFVWQVIQRMGYDEKQFAKEEKSSFSWDTHPAR